MKNFISKWRYCGIKKQTQQCSSWEVKINLWEESTQKLYYFVLNWFFFFFMKYKPKQLSLVSYILWRAIADMVWWTDGRWVYGQMGTCPTDKGGLSLNGNFWVSVAPLFWGTNTIAFTLKFFKACLSILKCCGWFSAERGRMLLLFGEQSFVMEHHSNSANSIRASASAHLWVGLHSCQFFSLQFP